MSTSIGARGHGSNGRARGCFTACFTQGRGLPSPTGNAPFTHGKRGRCGQLRQTRHMSNGLHISVGDKRARGSNTRATSTRFTHYFTRGSSLCVTSGGTASAAPGGLSGSNDRTSATRVIRARTDATSARIPRFDAHHSTHRSQVVSGRRQGRHITHRKSHDASNRRGRAVRVTQAGAPRGPVGASPEHRHRRRPHRHKNSARPHGHRQVAARVSGVPLRDAPQVEAGARHSITMPSAIRRGHTSALGGGACGLILMRGVIGLSVAANVAAGVNRKTAGIDRKTAGPTADCGAGGCPQSPPPLADARQQAPRRGPRRRLHSSHGGRGRQRRARDERRPHRLDIPRGDKRPDHRVERSPGRLGERQRAAQQLVGFFAHDEAGAAPRVSGSFAGWLQVAKRSIRRVCDRSGSCHAGGRGGCGTSGVCARVSGSFAGWLRVAKRSIRRVCDRSGCCHAGGRGGGATSGVCARVSGRRQRLAAVRVVTARGIADSGVQPRHLGRVPERAPQVLVAGNDAHEGVDDRHAVTAPPDNVDAGAHRGERGAPRGGTIRGPSIRNVLRTCLCKSLRRRNPRNGIPTARPAGGTRSLGHGLVPRDARRAHRAHRTRRAHGLSCRSRRGRRPSWTRPGRGS